MKSLKNTIFLVTFALFANQVFAMEMGGNGKQEEKEKTEKYPTPKVYFKITNKTNSTFLLMMARQPVASMAPGTTKEIEIPMHLSGFSFKEKTFFSNAKRLNFFDLKNKKDYPMEVSIAKSSNKIYLSIAIYREKIIEELRSAEEFVELTDTFSDLKTDEIQDSYNIEIILQGDDLKDSLLDYTSSLTEAKK